MKMDIPGTQETKNKIKYIQHNLEYAVDYNDTKASNFLAGLVLS